MTKNQNIENYVYMLRFLGNRKTEIFAENHIFTLTHFKPLCLYLFCIRQKLSYHQFFIQKYVFHEFCSARTKLFCRQLLFQPNVNAKEKEISSFLTTQLPFSFHQPITQSVYGNDDDNASSAPSFFSAIAVTIAHTPKTNKYLH